MAISGKKCRIPILSILFLVVISVLASCTTGNSSFSESDANYVMFTVLDTSVNKALPKTVTYIDSTATFIPGKYSVIEERRNTIAGLDTLLSDWTAYARTYVLQKVPDFNLLIDNLSEDFTITDPVNTAKGSKTSVTELFKSRNRIPLLKEINQALSQMDSALMDKAVNHYNQWVISNNKLSNTKQERQIALSDIKTDIASDLLENFFTNMALSEELFRTTPQPDMESVVENVLGFN